MSSSIDPNFVNPDCSTNLSFMAENLFFEHDLGKIQAVQALVVLVNQNCNTSVAF